MLKILSILKDLGLKRLVWGAFVTAMAAFMLARAQESSGQVILSAREDRLAQVKDKITGGDDWRPQGWGSGEYLPTIPTISAGAVIEEDSGNVIWSMNLKKEIAPASLAKLATVMTALDIAGPETKISVSGEASGQIPTKLGLARGEILTLDEMVSAAVMTSANDATAAIAHSLDETMGKGVGTFMELVNLKLAKIGAGDSHLETPTGLDSPGQFSTVYDLAMVARQAKKYPLIAQAGAREYVRLTATDTHRFFDLPNWNALLGTYPGVNGLKIGYTEEAGHVSIVTAMREGKNLIAIVVGAKSLEEREMAAATLLNYGFEKMGVAPFPLARLDLEKRFEDWERQLTEGE